MKGKVGSRSPGGGRESESAHTMICHAESPQTSHLTFLRIDLLAVNWTTKTVCLPTGRTTAGATVTGQDPYKSPVSLISCGWDPGMLKPSGLRTDWSRTLLLSLRWGPVGGLCRLGPLLPPLFLALIDLIPINPPPFFSFPLYKALPSPTASSKKRALRGKQLQNSSSHVHRHKPIDAHSGLEAQGKEGGGT